MVRSEFSWARIKERQARQFESLGDIASGQGTREETGSVDGHAVANACWAMAAYLKQQTLRLRAEESKKREAELRADTQ